MEKELKALGLSHYEGKALNLLFLDRLNIRQISYRASIPFGKVYSVIKSLKEKNLIKETNSRPKLVYVDNASGVITSLIDAKKERDRLITERLRQYVGGLDKSRGNETKFFQIGTTIEDNKDIQLRTFTEAKEEVLQILNIHHKPRSNRVSKFIWEKAIVKAVEGGIIFKSIYPKKAHLPEILKKLNRDHPKRFQVRRFNTDFVRCDIIDDDKVLIKLVQEDPLQFGGVLFIEDELMNQNLRRIFYEMWGRAKK